MVLLILKEENKQDKALQIIELLEENRIDEAVIAARKLSPYRLTGILGDFPLVKISDFLSLMDSSRAADVLNTFPENFAADIINILDSKTLLTIADEMASDDLVDFLQYLSEEKKQVLLDSFTREELREVEELASFPEDTVGAHMEQDFLDINDDLTVEECLKIVRRLQESAPVPDIGAISPNIEDENFDTLARSVRECIDRNEPETGLDRLHTFTVKYLRVLCAKRGIQSDREKPLHSLVGEYVKTLKNEGLIESEMTERILKSTISVMEAFNRVRNDQSYAHDNQVLNYNESLLIFGHVTSSIRFIEAIEKRMSDEPKPEEDDDISF